MRAMLILCFGLALLWSGPSSAWAQEGASLNEVESLAAQGRIMEARETLESWWMARFSNASRSDRQRGIWLRGKLTVDPSMAELDFNRLVLEFPGGPYSDDALFRLGLSAELMGDLREAQEYFQDLIRYYPSSPRVPEARSWLASHRRQLAELPELPEAEPEPRESQTLQDEPAGRPFSVQLGAFRSLERARQLALELRSAGFEPRIVRTPGNDLARVRIGRYPNREPAEGMARELEARGYEVTLATDASSEERVGGSSRS